MQAIYTLVIFIFLQIMLCHKAKSAIIRYSPFLLVAVGYLLCLALWLGAFDSFGDGASNRWLAIILLALSSRAFIGCLIGLMIYQAFKRKTK